MSSRACPRRGGCSRSSSERAPGIRGRVGRFSPRRQALAAARPPGAAHLGVVARRVRGRGRRDRVGRGRAVGRARVPRLLRRRRAAHCAAARRRVARARRRPPRAARSRSPTPGSPSASRSRCPSTACSRRTGSRPRRTTSPSPPPRLLAIVANILGTAAVVAVALRSIRRRPLGNGLIVLGVAAAAAGSGIAGLGAGGAAVGIAVGAALLYGGFVAPATLSRGFIHTVFTKSPLG